MRSDTNYNTAYKDIGFIFEDPSIQLKSCLPINDLPVDSGGIPNTTAPHYNKITFKACDPSADFLLKDKPVCYNPYSLSRIKESFNADSDNMFYLYNPHLR